MIERNNSHQQVGSTGVTTPPLMGRKPLGKAASHRKKARKPLPGRRKTIRKPGQSKPVASPAASAQKTLFDKQSVAWLLTLIQMQGGLHQPARHSTYVPIVDVGSKPEGHFLGWNRLSPDMRKGPGTQCKGEILKRFGYRSCPNSSPKPKGQVAYGSKKSLGNQARFHVETIDHKKMEKHDKPLMVLAITVCNLRNYYDQSKRQTVDLIRNRYNRRCGINWSEEDISLI